MLKYNGFDAVRPRRLEGVEVSDSLADLVLGPPVLSFGKKVASLLMRELYVIILDGGPVIGGRNRVGERLVKKEVE